MMVKNEADIVETTIRNLLFQCDEVIVSDNLSTDGTLDILQELETQYPRELSVMIDDEVGYYQSRKMTWLAGLASVRGHQWVLPCDADEIWFTRDGKTISELFRREGRRFGRFEAAVYNHYATVNDPDEPNPVKRMGWRMQNPLGLPKMATKLWSGIVIAAGNHNAEPPPNRNSIRQGALMVHHYPYRSPEQFVNKAVQGKIAYDATDLERGLGLHWREYGERIESEGEERGGHDWFNKFFRYEHPELAGRDGDPQPELELAPMVYDPVILP